MSGLWVIVGLLLGCFIALQYYYVRKSHRQVMSRWSDLEQSLQQRLQIISQHTNTAKDKTALEQAIKPLRSRQDTSLKKIRQRMALESRLSNIANSNLDFSSNSNQELLQILEPIQSSITSALSYYDIAGHRYNAYFRNWITNMIAGLSGLEQAPEIEIELIHHNNK